MVSINNGRNKLKDTSRYEFLPYRNFVGSMLPGKTTIKAQLCRLKRSRVNYSDDGSTQALNEVIKTCTISRLSMTLNGLPPGEMGHDQDLQFQQRVDSLIHPPQPLLQCHPSFQYPFLSVIMFPPGSPETDPESPAIAFKVQIKSDIVS